MKVLSNDNSGDFGWDITTLGYYIDPDHGEDWEKMADGRLRYRPQNDFGGADTFKYVICNSGGHCAIGTVIVAVEETPARAGVIVGHVVSLDPETGPLVD